VDNTNPVVLFLQG